MDNKEFRSALAEDREIKASQMGIGCLAVPVTAAIGAAIGGWFGFIIFIFLTAAALAAMQYIVQSNFEAKRKRAKATAVQKSTENNATSDQSLAHHDVNNPANWRHVSKPTLPASNNLVSPRTVFEIEGNPQTQSSKQKMTSDMITPVDKPVTTNEAVKVLRKFLSTNSELQSSVQELVVNGFGTAVDDAIDELSDCVTWAEDDVQNARSEIDQQQKEVDRAGAIADKLERQHELQYERGILEERKAELAAAKFGLQARRAELAAFKADKRDFLVAYTNNRLHGTEMPSLKTRPADTP